VASRRLENYVVNQKSCNNRRGNGYSVTSKPGGVGSRAIDTFGVPKEQPTYCKKERVIHEEIAQDHAPLGGLRIAS
jgi:hypothetical protein